jgi:hypothetical protein
MSIGIKATNNFFYQAGNRSGCRYILLGADARDRARIQNYFANLQSELTHYASEHAWPVGGAEMLQDLQVLDYSHSTESAILVNIPHCLVDAQGGLAAINTALSESSATEATEANELPKTAYNPDRFWVFRKDSVDVPSSDQTLTQRLLLTLPSLLTTGLRMVKHLNLPENMQGRFGNQFVTLDLEAQQLAKLLSAPKNIWKRFLETAGQKVYAQTLQSPDPGPLANRPLVTSVGALPGPSGALPHLAAAATELYMFPSAVPYASITVTVYSFHHRLYCILSGTEQLELVNELSQALQLQGFALIHQGA